MQDIILNEDDDLLFRNGDFFIGTSDKQHEKILINVNKGELKEYPTTGVGLNYYLASSNNKMFLKSEILKTLREDNDVIDKINITDDKNDFTVKIVSKYKNENI